MFVFIFHHLASWTIGNNLLLVIFFIVSVSMEFVFNSLSDTFLSCNRRSLSIRCVCGYICMCDCGALRVSSLFQYPFLLYNSRLKFFCYNSISFFLSINCASVFFCNLFLVHILNEWNMFLMNDFFLVFMNDWNVLLVDVLLINDWLDMFVNDWSVMLMNHIFMNLFNNVLVVFVDYFSVWVFNDGLLNDGLHNWSFLMAVNLCCTYIPFHNSCFFMSDHSSSFLSHYRLLNSNYLCRPRLDIGCSLSWSLNVHFSFVDDIFLDCFRKICV